MTTPWLSVVGIGAEGLPGLGQTARALIDSAEVLVGGERHLRMVPLNGCQRLPWPTPLQAAFAQLDTLRGRRVCVLATGDPLCFGIGRKLLQHFPLQQMNIVPAPSAFSLACARLGWSRQDIECLSAHGRPIEQLLPFVQPHAKLLLLTSDGSTAASVARLLTEKGYGPSEFRALENLGAPDESRRCGTAADWSGAELAPLNVLAIECRAVDGKVVLPTVAGLPDEVFCHDGQMTKREVRAATLAALMPLPGQVLWDVGAGAGSVAIEWLRAARRSQAIAIERHGERVGMLSANATSLGTPQLRIVHGTAPAALRDLPTPNATFVGGGLTTEGVVERCWDALRPMGRLVANAVTVEGEAALYRWQRTLGGELTRIGIWRAGPLGDLHGWRPLMPVTQWAVMKA